MTRKPGKAAIENAVNASFQANSRGAVINILNLGKVLTAGRNAYAVAYSTDDLDTAMRDAIAQHRVDLKA